MMNCNWRRFGDEEPVATDATVWILAIFEEEQNRIHSGFYCPEDREMFAGEDFRKPKAGDLWCYAGELLPRKPNSPGAAAYAPTTLSVKGAAKFTEVLDPASKVGKALRRSRPAQK